MSREFVDQLIDAAHNNILEGNFDDAVMLLKSIKLRVHDENLLKDVKVFEKSYDDKLIENEKIIKSKNLHTFDERREIISNRRLYSESYFKFYDKLRKEHELY